MTPTSSTAATTALPTTWSEKFGSRIALIALLAAVGFATFVAMSGQKDQDKIGPIAIEDTDLHLDSGEPTSIGNSNTKSTNGSAAAFSSDSVKPDDKPTAQSDTAVTKIASNSQESSSDTSSAPFPLTPVDAANESPSVNTSKENSIPAIEVPGVPSLSPQLPRNPLPNMPPHNVPSPNSNDPVMAKEGIPSGAGASGATEASDLAITGPLASRQARKPESSNVATLNAPGTDAQAAMGSRPNYPNTGYPLPRDLLRYLDNGPSANTASYGAQGPYGQPPAGQPPAVQQPFNQAPNTAMPNMVPPGYPPQQPTYAPIPSTAPNFNPGVMGPAGYAPPTVPAPTYPGAMPPAPNPY